MSKFKPGVTLTDMKVWGMLPTPQASDFVGTVQQNNHSLRHIEHNSGWVAKLLPTPRANQVNGCNLNSENLANRNKGNLEETVAKWVTGILPTPTKSDFQHRNKSENWEGSDLVSTISETHGRNSQLNPLFVGEMMGFPPNWTVLPFQSGETNPLKPTEMP
jgi:hypothetical protein